MRHRDRAMLSSEVNNEKPNQALFITKFTTSQSNKTPFQRAIVPTRPCCTHYNALTKQKMGPTRSRMLSRAKSFAFYTALITCPQIFQLE
eukprot:387588-Pelagomonas_calceolata.AAC.11